MSSLNIPNPDWQLFLSDLDAALTEPTRLHCIGGFVVTQVYGFDRPTADLDVVDIAPLRERETLLGLAGKGSDLTRRTSLYLDYVGVSYLPEEYESRLTEVFPGRYKNLRLLAIEAHDLALTKLGRDSPKDRIDVRHLAVSVPLSEETLRERYQTELRWMLTGDPAWTDATLELWIEMIREAQAEATR